MTGIPRQIGPEVRKAIEGLTVPWTIIKKRDHYFLQVGGIRPICVGNNSSKISTNTDKMSAKQVRRLCK